MIMDEDGSGRMSLDEVSRIIVLILYAERDRSGNQGARGKRKELTKCEQLILIINLKK